MNSRLLVTTRVADLTLASIDGSVAASIGIRGTLTDADNSPISTTISAIFTIYDVPVSGTGVWSERREITSDAHGLFTILLGDSAPIPEGILASSPLYLGIQVGADTGTASRTVITSASSARQVDVLQHSATGIINRVAQVLPGGGVTGVRDPGGNVGGGSGVSGVRDPGGNIDGAKTTS